MKIESKNDQIVLKEVYSGITLETDEGKQMYICARDNGFDIKFENGKTFHVSENVDVISILKLKPVYHNSYFG